MSNDTPPTASQAAKRYNAYRNAGGTLNRSHWEGNGYPRTPKDETTS